VTVFDHCVINHKLVTRVDCYKLSSTEGKVSYGAGFYMHIYLRSVCVT